MRDYIIINGIKSTEIPGLMIQTLPPITKPLLRTEITEIDGRDGDLITPLGYSAYDKTATIGLYGDFDIDRVIAFFTGSGFVTFSNEADKAYKYTITAQIDYDKLVRFRTANITFHCQPFKYALGETARKLDVTSETKTGTSFTIPTTTTPLADLEILGNCEQVSTPSPANPVPVKVVTRQNNIVYAKGSNSSIYAYDLGSIELASLDVTDRIYKTDKWYLEKAVGKLTISVADTYPLTNVSYALISKPASAIHGTGYNYCMSSVAPYEKALSSFDSADGIGKLFSQADDDYFVIGFAPGTTKAEMQEAIDGAVLYYPLATATTTEIPSTLATQLDGILQAPTFDGSTTIKATEYTRAKPIYKATAKGNSIEIHNIGNYPAKPKMTIYGSGNIIVYCNGSVAFTIALGAEEYITIDTQEMEAYKGSELKNRLVAGSYDNFALQAGKNKLVFAGNVEKVIVENYARYL